MGQIIGPKKGDMRFETIGCSTFPPWQTRSSVICRFVLHIHGCAQTHILHTNDKTKHFMVMCQDFMGFHSEQRNTLCMIIQQFAMEDDRWVDDSLLFYTYIMRRYCASFALSCYATVCSFALWHIYMSCYATRRALALTSCYASVRSFALPLGQWDWLKIQVQGSGTHTKTADKTSKALEVLVCWCVPKPLQATFSTNLADFVENIEK